MNRKNKVRSLNLLSGGLDSILSVKVLMEQGIEVTGITFTSPFFGSANAQKGAAQLGIKLLVVDITDDHLKLVKNPPHGYGKCMNPCIDCHALMVQKACEIAKRDGYDVIATGEVLGERPMSQNRQALDVVARESGGKDVLLRPLSAKNLPPTRPEIDGLVDREKLFGFKGRSRKPQMALAEKYGIKSYMQPAGGCLLTDPSFSTRLRDLFSTDKDASVEDIKLLKLGRHFRLGSGAKVIVGRNKMENEKLDENSNTVVIEPSVTPGPTVLLIGSQTTEDIELAAKMCASFSDHNNNDIKVSVRLGSEVLTLNVTPGSRSEFEKMRI